MTAVWRQWYCTAASPSSANGMHVFRKGTHRVRKDVQVLHVWTQQEAGEHVQWWRGEGLVVTSAFMCQPWCDNSHIGTRFKPTK